MKHLHVSSRGFSAWIYGRIRPKTWVRSWPNHILQAEHPRQLAEESPGALQPSVRASHTTNLEAQVARHVDVLAFNPSQQAGMPRGMNNRTVWEVARLPKPNAGACPRVALRMDGIASESRRKRSSQLGWKGSDVSRLSPPCTTTGCWGLPAPHGSCVPCSVPH